MFGGGRRRGGPQRGADLRYDLEIAFEQAARGAETTIQIPRHETCETCKGSGAAPGTSPDAVSAMPRQRATPLPAGVLHRGAHLRSVPRRRQGHRQALRHVPRPGDDRAAAQADGQDSGRHRHRSAPAPHRRGRGRRARRAARRSLRGHPRHASTSSSSATATTCTAKCRSPSPTLALGGEITVPGIEGDETVKVPKGTQPGTTSG